MEISAFIADLKKEASEIEPKIATLNEAVDSLRRSLSAAEQDLALFTDRIAAINLAVESLELFDKSKKAPETPGESPRTCVNAVAKAERPAFSRKPKRIIKMDANGNGVCAYSSINKCAKAMGWTNAGVRKYIENVSREKQIKLRGFILAWAE